MNKQDDSHILHEVCIIVPIRNEGKYVEAAVQSLIRASRDMAKIIIIDDGSTDETSVTLEKFQDSIEVIRTEGIGASASRNAALARTERQFIAFTDGDCIVDEDWLVELVKGISSMDETVVAVGGPQLVFPQSKWKERLHADILHSMHFVSDYLHQQPQMVKVNHNPTCNVMYKREALVEVGGFDTSLWPCEDLDLDIRLSKAGYQFYCTPTAKVMHRRPESFAGFCSMMNRYGMAHGKLFHKHHRFQNVDLISLSILCALIWAIWSGLASLLWLILGILVGFWVLFSLKIGLLRAVLASGYFMIPFFLWNFSFYIQLIRGKK
ncbi:MAG: glycosyltransferase [Bdellovibrionota bacterium]